LRRWWFGAAGLVLFLAVVAAAGWHDLATARSQLNDARSQLSRVVDDPSTLRTKEGRRTAREAIEAAIASTNRARSRVTGSLPLRLASWIPGMAQQRTGITELTEDAGLGARVSLQLLTTIDAIADRSSIRDGAIPLAGLAELQEAVRVAGQQLKNVRRGDHGLWRSVREARRRLNEVAALTSARLLAAADSLGVARDFIGASGPRRYFVPIQNNAEMRDQGMVLSYAVVSFDAGHMSVDRSGEIADVRLRRPISLPLGPGTKQLFGDFGPQERFQSVNTTADFPWSARAMTEMYEQATGEHVDGVVAIDVPGLARILSVIGSVKVVGISEQIDATSAGRILLNDLYIENPDPTDQERRKDRLGEVAGVIIEKLTSGSHDAIALGRELGEAAVGGHFRMWSEDAAEERTLERTGLGGGPASREPTRTFHVAVENATISKLDYFVRPRVDMEVILTPEGTAVIRTTVDVVNTAPAGRKPSYQLGGLAGQLKPGEYVGRIHLWGPRGAIQLDGVPESGLIGSSREVHVDPSGSTPVRFETIIPDAVQNGVVRLRLVPQPRLDPMQIRLHLQAEGWHVDGPTTVARGWDRTFTQTWGVSR
jgi:hypothetical protein